MKCSFIKKGLAVGIISLLLGITLISASATDIPESLICEKHMNNGLLYDNRSLICTHGPFMPILNIATINLTDGDPEQIEKIEQILDNRILQLILLEQEVDVTGLDFSITYNWNIPRSQSFVVEWIFLRFRYNTYISQDGNETIIGYVKHTVIVKGFEGEFSLGRPPFFRFFPPTFAFIGDCEEITIIT